MKNASRGGLGFQVPSHFALSEDFLIICLEGDVVFEARVARQSGETCEVRLQGLHPIAALPPQLKFIAMTRRHPHKAR